MKFYEGPPMFTLRMEGMATSNSAQQPDVIYDAVHSLMSVAAKLNVITIAQLNGTDLMCFPTDFDVEAKVDALKRGWEMRASVIS